MELVRNPKNGETLCTGKHLLRATCENRFRNSEKRRQKGFRAPERAVLMAKAPRLRSDSTRFPALGAKSLTGEAPQKE